MPYQASITVSEPASKQTSAIFPHGLAMRIFFAMPKAKNETPRANLARL